MDLQNEEVQKSINDDINQNMNEQQRKFDDQFFSVKISKNQHRDLSTKYEGYLQIAKRKINPQNPEYFNSPFLKELKQKRNNMFSDEIIEKMLKQYSIQQYGTSINSESFLPQNSKGEKYGKIETISFQQIERRMTKS